MVLFILSSQKQLNRRFEVEDSMEKFVGNVVESGGCINLKEYKVLTSNKFESIKNIKKDHQTKQQKLSIKAIKYLTAMLM